MAKRFTEEDKQFVIDNYDKMTLIEIGKKLGVSNQSINNLRKRLGLKTVDTRSNERITTKSQDQFIINNYSSMDTNLIAKHLGLSSTQVKNRALKLGVRKPKSTYNRDYFETIDTAEKAYWLGFIYADGYVIDNESSGNYEFAIELQSTDSDHLKKLNKSLNSDKQIGFRSRSKESLRKFTKIENYNKVCDSCFVRYYDIKIVRDLAKYGVIQNKTYSMKLPELDRELMSHFLRGFMDGDGCISGGTISFRSWKKDFAESIVKIFNEECNSDLKEPYMDGTSYHVVFGKKEQVKSILTYLYKDAEIYLDRKYEKYLITMA